jgi:hypothetical protein
MSLNPGTVTPGGMLSKRKEAVMGSFTQVCVWVYSRTCHAGSDCPCRQKSEGSLLTASRVRGPRTHGNGRTGHETPKATQMRLVGRTINLKI